MQLTAHPLGCLHFPDVIRRGWQPAQVFQDVLLRDEPDRHLGVADQAHPAEDPLAQPDTFGVMVDAAVPDIPDDLLG